MDIGNVNNQGSVDRAGERGARAAAKRVILTPVPPRSDDARISEAGHETAALIERLTQRAMSEDAGRAALVAAAKGRLLSGELNSPEVFAATAARIAETDFCC